MDTLFHHRAVAAVGESLAAAGYEGFALSPALGRNIWFNLDWLYDYLRRLDHREIPLRWEGRPLPVYDCLRVTSEGWSRPVERIDRHGLVVIRGEVAVAGFDRMSAHCGNYDYIIVGERRAGALQEFLDGYCGYARERTRENRAILVSGGDPEERPNNLRWEDLVLPPELCDEIRSQVDGFFSSREHFRRWNLPYRRGFLLVGPPGNGKTSVLRVIASRRKEPFIVFRPHSESDVAELEDALNLARFNAPSILVFEDVDSVFKSHIPLSAFLNSLDGLSSVEGVLVLATTNHPEELDEAITNRPSRFDRVWTFPNPEPRERREYLLRFFAETFDEELVRWTDGLSFAHLKEVWVSACIEAMQSGQEHPTTEAAKRAIERVQGHRVTAERGFETKTRPVGFRRAGSG